MKSKITRLFVAMLISIAAITGSAGAASASTTYYNNCKYSYTATMWTKSCWVDYNWWEEMWGIGYDRYEPVAYGFR